jgi:hypothetical protein
MPYCESALRNSWLCKRLAIALLLALSVTGCAPLTLTSASPSEVPPSLARPAACDQFRLITWTGGRRGLALDDVYNELAMMSDETSQAKLSWLRAVTGDTNETIEQVKSHNAAWRALCEPKGVSNELAE